MMTSVQAISFALLTFITTGNAAALHLFEGGTASACTGATGCCIPSCNVEVFESLPPGGSGVVSWAGNCRQNWAHPSGTQDVDDDHQMTWLRDESGQVVIDVFRKSDKKYDRWTIFDCELPHSVGGSQCAPSGGGCDNNQTLFSAQG